CFWFCFRFCRSFFFLHLGRFCCLFHRFLFIGGLLFCLGFFSFFSILLLFLGGRTCLFRYYIHRLLFCFSRVLCLWFFFLFVVCFYRFHGFCRLWLFQSYRLCIFCRFAFHLLVIFLI